MAYRRPTMKRIRQLEDQVRSMQSFYWLEGFRAGRRTNQMALDAGNLAAHNAVVQSFARERQLRAAVDMWETAAEDGFIIFEPGFSTSDLITRTRRAQRRGEPRMG